MTRSLAIIFVLALVAGCSADRPSADIVYTNGRIYTVNEAQPWAEAVAIQDGKFLVVGSNADVEAVTGNATEVVDLSGAFAMPGLIDIHGFHGMSVDNRVYCELKGTFWEPTEEEILADLRACAEEYPAEPEWFIAEGFTPAPMSKEALSLATLDEIEPDKPAYVGDESGHNGWVNSRALEVAGVTAATPDPPLGYYERDESGSLTGRVFESAMNTFTDLIPAQDLATQKLGTTKFLRQATEKGVTAIGHAYNFERHLPAWQDLKAGDELEIHVVLFQDGNFGTADLNPVADLLARYEDYDLPGPPGVKIGIDGAVESGTSPMVDGYRDASIEAKLVIEPETLSTYVAELDEHGFQVKIHAIGDLAVRSAIDALEPVIRAAGGNPNRHHIDHNSHVKPADMSRMADLGIPATIWAVLNAPVSYNLDIVRPMLSEAQWARGLPEPRIAGCWRAPGEPHRRAAGEHVALVRHGGERDTRVPGQA